VGRGEPVLVLGERSPGLFILLAGEVEMTRLLRPGQPMTSRFFGGVILGERSILTRQPVDEAVRTVSDCWFLQMDRKEFSEALLTYPMVLEYVNELSEKRRELPERVELL
jgi:CRP-like cAMP-binding protein